MRRGARSAGIACGMYGGRGCRLSTIGISTTWTLSVPTTTHTHQSPVASQCNDTSSQSHLGRDASPPLTAESGLARCMCQLCSAHCRWVQSLSCRYTTSTLDRRTHDDGIQRASKRRTITTTTTRLAHSQNCCCGRILLEYLATSGTKS